MLTAVFKDYLIFDDIYEFIDKHFTFEQSKVNLLKFAQTMNQVAVNKYAFTKSHHENIINRPNYVLCNRYIHKIMHNNLKMKYLMRYEQRL